MHRFKACQVSLLKAARPTGSSVLSQNKSNLLKLTTNTGGKSRYGISSSTSRKKKSQAEQKQQERAFKRTVSILGKKFEIHRVCFFFLLRGHALLQTLLPKEAEALHFQTQLSAAYRANILQGSLALLTSYFHIRSHKLHSR